MPTWAGIIVGIAGVIVAIGVIYKKMISPAAVLISTAERGAPVFREMIEQFGDMPEALKVLKDIAKQFHTDSGTTLRDVVNRLERAAEANRLAIEELVNQETKAANAMGNISTGQEASRMLAQEDRVQIAKLLVALRQVNIKVDEAAAGAILVAQDLEKSHLRAEELPTSASPGEASDSAMRRPGGGK